MLLSCSRGDTLVFGHEFFLCLLVVWIDEYAVNRTDLDTLLLFIVPDTLGAEIRIDLVNLVSLVDSAILAFGFADIAVDTFISDIQCHCASSSGALTPKILLFANYIVPEALF